MSAGSGFHSITGDWQYTDYASQPGIWQDNRNAGKKKYKSRKIAIGSSVDKFKFTPMGFIKIGRKSEEELEKDKYEFVAKLEAERKIKEDLLIKLEQAEIVRLQAIADERNRFNRIETLRLQKEAEEKQVEAKRLEDIRLKLEVDEKAQIERLVKKVEEGLVFLKTSKNFDDARRRIDEWMKKAKVEILPVNQHQFLFDAITRFYYELKPKEKLKWTERFDNNHFWKKISIWIGDELAHSWYKELTEK